MWNLHKSSLQQRGCWHSRNLADWRAHKSPGRCQPLVVEAPRAVWKRSSAMNRLSTQLSFWLFDCNSPHISTIFQPQASRFQQYQDQDSKYFSLEQAVLCFDLKLKQMPTYSKLSPSIKTAVRVASTATRTKTLFSLLWNKKMKTDQFGRTSLKPCEIVHTPY